MYLLMKETTYLFSKLHLTLTLGTYLVCL